MYARNIHGLFLVVVPLSTIAGWVREFRQWLPDMNVICYVGNSKSRDMIREHEFFSSAKGGTEKFHTLLTTPELLMQDVDYLGEFRWCMIAVDEAHRLKNETSALHTTIAGLRSGNCLLVTETPLQNSVRQLWALLRFLNTTKFPSAEAFEERFSFAALRDPERVSELHNTLSPYIMRRQKGDVEKSLPKKTYAVLRVEMTSAQQQYYRWLLTKNLTKLNEAGKARGIGNTSSIRNIFIELKKCCNHPNLFPNYADTSTPTTVEELIRASGKMNLLDKLMLRLKERGRRMLIFSQMVKMLNIL
ncbi:SNF2-like protein [Gracilaria domingensis]|nr:SNF2-like protein [Gracilaria domingensis]